MNYQASDFGRELLWELNRGYNIVRISRWAMAAYLKHSSCTDPSLDSEIMKVIAMEEGPEFEMTEEELRKFAQRLIALMEK